MRRWNDTAPPGGDCRQMRWVIGHSDVWLSEIVRYRRKEILDRLQHSFGREVILTFSISVFCHKMAG